MKTINVDIYQFIFEDNVKHETYKNEWYYGVIFHDPEGGKYDVIHNYLIGNRLLINNKDGWKDVPFKKDTFHLLPAGVIVNELC